jgi:hypothetical protein
MVRATFCRVQASKRFPILAVWSIFALLIRMNLQAQEGPAPASRVEQIESEQTAKAQKLTPDVQETGRLEQPVVAVGRFLQESKIHIQFGGLPMPAQLAFGPAFKWHGKDDKVLANVWGAAWIHGFYGVGTGLEFPRVSRRRFDVVFDAAHLDLPQLDFYGQGPQSSKSNRTDYRQEDTTFAAHVDWPINDHVRPRCTAEQLLLNVGPGTSTSVTSTNLKFTEAQAPGIDIQSNFFIPGCGLRLDYRDTQVYPKKGTALFLDYRRYVGQQLSSNSFHRATASIQQYIPFLNRARVIALHAAADMTFHDSDQVVPFYLQPTLGGFSDLRGYRPYRFYDENAVVANAEYRWEIFTGLDMAVFADAGEVFHRPWQFNTSYIQNDVGFGLRVNDQRKMILRTDLGFSREGFYAWIVFDKVF